MRPNSPTVSIVIPTYQRAHLLARALESIANQTWRDWEVIVVDDGSTDGTQDIVETFRKRHRQGISYCFQQNRGASAARNVGIESTRGKFLAFLDSDDTFASTKLARHMEMFARCPRLGMVFSDFAYADLVGRPHASALRDFFPTIFSVPMRPVGKRDYLLANDAPSHLTTHYCVATIAAVVRRDAIGAHIRFAENVSYSEEWLFFARVASQSPVGFIDESLAVHHFCGDSVTRGPRCDNTLGRYRALEELLSQARHLTYEERTHLGHQLAQVTSQLGYDRLHQGGWDEAAHWFWKRVHANPRAHTVMQAIWHSLTPLGAKLAMRGTQ